MSLQAVKAVEIGRGVTAAESFGSTVHDAIGYAEGGGRASTQVYARAEQCRRASKAASRTAKTSWCAGI